MKSYILTGGVIHPENIHISPAKDDLIIAADSGLLHAAALGLSPAIVVGDYDSLGHAPEVDAGVEVITVPAEKDETDTQLAVRVALARGADEIHILGGLSSRLDHTLSNLSILEELANQKVRAMIEDGQNRVRLLRNDSTILPRSGYTYVSLLALDPLVRGVEIDGVKYPLKGAKLTRSLGYAVSNEITGNCCFIAVRRGAIWIVESRDMPAKA
ncbi:MAG: thiamine diphosphokinase [Ruminococcaceae bacterium]|nr:thiamine diphosphokinase [Oscillospiraceae bacterium]